MTTPETYCRLCEMQVCCAPRVHQCVAPQDFPNHRVEMLKSTQWWNKFNVVSDTIELHQFFIFEFHCEMAMLIGCHPSMLPYVKKCVGAREFASVASVVLNEIVSPQCKDVVYGKLERNETLWDLS